MNHNILYLRKKRQKQNRTLFTKFIDTRLLRRCQGDARRVCWLGESDCSTGHTDTHRCTDSKARSVKESLRRAYGLSLQVIDIGPIMCGRSINYILRALLRHLSYLTRGYYMIHSFMIAESDSGTD